MKRLSLALLLLGVQSLFAVTQVETFAKYKNRYFVETGTLDGEGIQKALDAGFQEIYSIELSQQFYERAKERFKNNPHVHLVQGDSGKVLWEVIQKLDGPITFWLDGHYSGGTTALGETNTPLLREIHAIKKHPIKTHTILIDDVRDLGKAGLDFIPLERVVKKLKRINKNYKITFEDGYVKKDVLVASIPPQHHLKEIQIVYQGEKK